MHVAIATGLVRAVSPESTGGTEMFTHILTEGLVEKGIDTTLFATSDSDTQAKLISLCSSQQTHGVYEGGIEIRIPYEVMQADSIAAQSSEFDLIHNNYWHFYILPSSSAFISCPMVTTIHNNYWELPNLKNILAKTHRKDKDIVVFLSQSAKKRAGDLVNSVVINNGIDVSLFPFSATSENSFLFFSRLVPSKGMEDALKAANTGGFHLTLAGVQSTRPDEKAFFEKNIIPLFSEFVKYVSPPDINKVSLYQHAKAFIFPAQAEEQFPLTVLEAMACGTPVIAYNRGAISEEVADGVTGFIIDPDDTDRPGKGSWIIKQQGVAGLIEAMKRIDEIDRAACRDRVEKLFTTERMINEYIALYKRVLNK